MKVRVFLWTFIVGCILHFNVVPAKFFEWVPVENVENCNESSFEGVYYEKMFSLGKDSVSFVRLRRDSTDITKDTSECGL